MADDPILEGIATQTFRLVRKGFDPEEVRSYLVGVAAAVDRRAPTAPSAAAGVGAGTDASDDVRLAVEEAQADLARLRSEQAALRAWFGEDGRPDAVLVPKPVRDASATADTIVRAAEARAAEIRGRAEAEAAERLRAVPDGPPAAAPAVQSWDDVGGSVARVLAGAEQEAIAIRAQAEEAAAGARAEAERLEAQAAEALAQARAQADDVVRAAEARAAQLESSAEEGARTHVAEVLGRAEVDLDRTRRELDQAHGQLEEIHALVGRSLAQRAPRPAFDDPAEVVATAPAPPPESPSATAPAADAAVTVVAPPIVVAPPVVASTAPDPSSPGPAAGPVPADPAAPWAAPAPPSPDGRDLVAPPAPSVLAAAGLEAAPGAGPVAAPGAPPAEQSVRTVLAGTGVPSEDEAAWSPLRTFRARLGAEGDDASASEGASAPVPAESGADGRDAEVRAPGWLTPPSAPPPTSGA